MDCQSTTSGRRTTLKLLLGLPFFGASVPNLMVRAQEGNPQQWIDNANQEAEEITQSLIYLFGAQDRVARAEQLQDSYARQRQDDELRYLLSRDRSSRRELANRLQGNSRDELQELSTSPRETRFIVSSGLSLVPSPDLVQIEAPTILPPANNEEPWIVVVDILIDTLDIAVSRSLVQQVLEGDPMLRAQFEELANAVSTRSWSDVAEQIDNLLTHLISVSFLERLVSIAQRQLGDGAATQIMRRTAFRLSVRFVPFVGWLYTGVAFMVALKRNIHRF